MLHHGIDQRLLLLLDLFLLPLRPLRRPLLRRLRRQRLQLRPWQQLQHLQVVVAAEAGSWPKLLPEKN